MRWWAWILLGLVTGASLVWIALSTHAATQQRQLVMLYAADSVRHRQDSLGLAASQAQSNARDSTLAALRDTAQSVHRATLVLGAALRRADSAATVAQNAIATAQTLRDTATVLATALGAATQRADLAEQGLASMGREGALLASDTTLLRAQITAAMSRAQLLAADRDRWEAVADSAVHLKPVPSGRLFGLIPLPHLTAGYGVMLARDGRLHDGAALAVSFTLK